MQAGGAVSPTVRYSEAIRLGEIRKPTSSEVQDVNTILDQPKD